MEEIKRRCNTMIDLSKFTSNKKILSNLVTQDKDRLIINLLCSVHSLSNIFFLGLLVMKISNYIHELFFFPSQGIVFVVIFHRDVTWLWPQYFHNKLLLVLLQFKSTIEITFIPLPIITRNNLSHEICYENIMDIPFLITKC